MEVKLSKFWESSGCEKLNKIKCTIRDTNMLQSSRAEPGNPISDCITQM